MHRICYKRGDKMEDISDLLEGLRRTPRILTEFVKTIPKSKLDLRRDEGFWTVAEHNVLMHDYWHMYRMEELWITKDAYLTRLE